MIGTRKILAVIPARGGSKGLPGKNKMDFCGKPLIEWTILAAKESAYIDKIIISSDDETILKIGVEKGCQAPFKRPPELSDDTASIEDVMYHILENIKETYEFLVILQPTSPLRMAIDIDACIGTLHSSNVSSCVSATPAPKPPQWMFTLDENDKIQPILQGPKGAQRQELQKTYVYNGAVYVLNVSDFLKARKIVSPDTSVSIMPNERSVDIDTEFDFVIAQTLATQSGRFAIDPIE